MMTTVQSAVSNMWRSLNPALIYPEKRDSLQLEQFRCYDFSSIPAEVAAVFQNAVKIRPQNLPLASRVAVDGAGPYDLDPVRELVGVSSQVAQRFSDVYAEMGVNALLLELEQAGTLQQSYLIGSWPDSRGRMRLHSFLPYQVASIAFDDDDAMDDIADASEVVLCRVVQRKNALGMVSPWVTQLVLTRTEAWKVLPDGGKVGLFNPDGSNPLGQVPLCATRRVRPVFSATNRTFGADGGFLPGIANDVRDCHIGLTLGVSHLHWVVRSQTHTKLAVFGEDAADLPDQIKDTPDGAILFPAEVQVTPITLNPPVEKYIRVLETTTYYLSQFRYLRPEAYAASIVTGSARRADALGFTAQQQRQTTRCVKLEQDLKRLVALVYNATQRTALKLPPDAELKVQHRTVKTDENVLQEQQAMAVKLQNLMTSHVEEIAKAEGITTDAARKRALDRLDDLGKFLRAQPGAAGKTPGLDAIDTGTTDPTAEGDGPAALNASGEVQKQALNGAQVEALKGIVGDVASGQLPVESAREMIRASFPIDDSVVDAMLEAVNGFVPRPAPEPAQPFGGGRDVPGQDGDRAGAGQAARGPRPVPRGG